MRVVSLLASGTEIVCALGAGDSLVGRSHECDNPAWVRSLPKCSEPAFDVSVSSREIDAEVGRRMRAGEPLYIIHNDLIRDLKPDVIIAQEHCEVCAVTPGDVDQTCAIGARVVSLQASSLNDVFGGILTIAGALRLGDRGDALVECEKQRLEAVQKRVAGRSRPSVVVLEWIDPAYAMGNWGPELVEYAGGRLVLGHPGQLSYGMANEKVLEANPEYLIVAPCGFDLDRTIRECANVAWWNGLRSRIAVADGNMFFNRSGMTVSHSAEMIAEILHAEVFGMRTEGIYWRWWN
jgi:iron complex transport system substrate-binding protein